jgi:oxygen-independent coproporphyrinogen-3 oxidase
MGLGTSSISDAKYAYSQNEKKVEDYMVSVNRGKIPFFKGHVQSDEDLTLRRLISDIICNGHAHLRQYPGVVNDDVFFILNEMKMEGIIDFSLNEIQVTNAGRPFIRNIAAVFDKRMKEKSGVSRMFSKSI